ncbi:D-3-phosphoglycerate dehydrogenase 3 [Hibiscus syriacus]|uniref:D-3-phosphoglycerate dehydrogenase 3 n=1 Tax=Hibiscus syriacus TaxID=106335 RepID=A0A6A3CF02_HIBSY|nr:D-3-phosphoglycerate dehydrogenase 3 [Hibiscus syriacus]
MARNVAQADALLKRKGVRIVNVARSCVIDEEALIRALDARIVAQAALDVFTEEPPLQENKLVRHEYVTVTPHLGASTTEAQEGVALEIAEAVVGALKGDLATTAVNAPIVPTEVLLELSPYVALTEKLGRLAVQLVAGGSAKQRGLKLTKERIVLDGSPEKPFEFIQVRIANVESKFASAVCDSGEITVDGRVKNGKPHLTKVGSFGVDVSLEGSMILCRQVDQPGIIGKVGSILGEENAKVNFMSVCRIAPRKQAVMAIGVDEEPNRDGLKKIREISAVEEFMFLKL